MISLSSKHKNYQNQIRKANLAKSIQELREKFESGLYNTEKNPEKEAEIFCFIFALEFKVKYQKISLDQLKKLIDSLRLLSKFQKFQVFETLLENQFDEFLFQTVAENSLDSQIVRSATGLIAMALKSVPQGFLVNLKHFHLIMSLLRTNVSQTFINVLTCIADLISEDYFWEKFEQTEGFEEVKKQFSKFYYADKYTQECGSIMGGMIILLRAMVEKMIRSQRQPPEEFLFDLIKLVFEDFFVYSDIFWRELLVLLELLYSKTEIDAFLAPKLLKQALYFTTEITKKKDTDYISSTLRLLWSLAEVVDEELLFMIVNPELEDFYLRSLQETFEETMEFANLFLALLERCPNQVDMLFKKNIYEQIMFSFEHAKVSIETSQKLIELVVQLFDHKIQGFIEYAVFNESFIENFIKFFGKPAVFKNESKLLHCLCLFFRILNKSTKIDIYRKYARIVAGSQDVNEVLCELANSNYDPKVFEELNLIKDLLLPFLTSD